MEKLEYRRYYTNINKNVFTTVPKVMIYFLIPMELMRFSVEFCVVKFSSFG